MPHHPCTMLTKPLVPNDLCIGVPISRYLLWVTTCLAWCLGRSSLKCESDSTGSFSKVQLTFLIGMVLKGVMDKNPQKSEIRKYAILTQPRNFPFF